MHPKISYEGVYCQFDKYDLVIAGGYCCLTNRNKDHTGRNVSYDGTARDDRIRQWANLQ